MKHLSRYKLIKKAAATMLMTGMVAVAFSQSLKGITNKQDTGYNTNSAFRYDVQSHPGISIVQELKDDKVSEQRNLVYCEQGSRKLLLDVFAPKQQAQARTAFIMIHGGGWRTGNRTQHYPLVQALAARGYVCFTPEYRLSTEALFPTAIYDLKAAVRWVKANAATYGIDTAKIVIGGFSAGGELAAFMGVTGNMPLFEGAGCNNGFNTKVNAIVDIDGTLSFTHPESGEGDDSKSTSAATYWFGYGKKENKGLWDAASPLTYVGSQTPPTLFLSSSVVHMHAGRADFIKVLNEYGIYSEVHGFDDAPHSFPLYHPWFKPMVDDIDSFMKKVFANK